MNVKNLTPYFFGTKVTSREPKRLEMSVAVRAAFTLDPDSELEELEGLDQGFMAAEEFAEEDDDRAGASETPDDFADYKLHTDLLFKGHCHVPGGKPTPASMVRFDVGGWHKEVLVIGDRVRTTGILRNQLSDPLAFVSMPLTWDRAFGGPGFDRNPSGRGYKGDELPNLELPGEEIRGSRDRPRPAGVGPVSSQWAPRAGKVGRKYGGRYKAERAPFYAEDFDWTYFQAAPEDQQLKRYLRGDESLSFTNVHPEVAGWSTRLPGLRVRTFIKDVGGKFREAVMNLDTLFADLDAGVLYLTWRGLFQVAKDDLSDVATMLIASEPLDEACPDEHYVEQLERFEADPLGLEDLPDEMKEGLKIVKAMEAGASPAEALAGDDEDSPAPAGESGAAQFILGEVDKAGLPLPPEHRATVARLLDQQSEMAAKEGVDLAAKLKEAAAKAPTGMPVAPAAPGVVPRVPLADKIAKLRELAENAKKAAEEGGADLSKFAAFDAFLENPALKQLDPSYRAPGESGPTEEEPAPGADLRWRDFSHQDFSGRDLHGARFEGCNLTGADLSGCNLSGASFENACLQEAKLDGADLSGVQMEASVLTEAQGEKASFRGARLSRAVFTGAVLRGADLSDVDLTEAIGEGADLTGANLTGARCTAANLTGIKGEGACFDRAEFERTFLSQAHLAGVSFVGTQAYLCAFTEADFTGARFSEVSIRDSLLDKVKLDGVRVRESTISASMIQEASVVEADLEGTDLTRTAFMKSDLTRARMVGVTGKGASFNEATLEETDFANARLVNGYFIGAVMTRTRFWRAGLVGCRFDKADARGVQWVGANLRNAEFCRARIEGARFTAANLFNAKFFGTEVVDCDFEDANMKLVLMEAP